MTVDWCGECSWSPSSMGLLLDQYECQCCDVSESVAGVAIVPRVMEEVGGVNLD